MSNEKEMSEEDKVTQAEDLNNQAEGREKKELESNQVEEISQEVEKIDQTEESIVQVEEQEEVSSNISIPEPQVEEVKVPPAKEEVVASNEDEQIATSDNIPKESSDKIDEIEPASETIDSAPEEKNEANTSEAMPETAPTASPGKEEEKEEVNVSASSEQEAEDEENTEEDHDEDHEVDYSSFSKRQLIGAVKDFIQGGNFLKNDAHVQEIKGVFDEIHQKEKEEALQNFLAEGGAKDDFEYRDSEDDKLFLASYFLFKEKRTEYFKEKERQKEKNLFQKNQILDQLRELVDSEENNHSISAIKKIQEEWKSIGPVPPSQNRNLWASYNALMDRFYDNRSIYFELKELDRKKNYESKIELCEKAEALNDVPNLGEAIKALSELHEEFKHIGPVPKDDQEAVWTRFKAASDAVYHKRKELFESQKEVFQENLEKKQELLKKLESFEAFQATKIKEWNAKTKELLEVQKEWEGVGPVPREKAKEVNKKFWGLFKSFFQHKNQFFKGLDEVRNSNKKLAEEYIKEAETLMESSDWQSTTEKLIALQQNWKKLGPLPEKHREQLYKSFKKNCDHFFERKRNSNKKSNQEFEQNLRAKEDVCNNILAEASGESLSEESLVTFINSYNEIGFVPRKNIKEIAAKFNKAVDTYVEKMGIDGAEKEDFLFRLNLNKLQADPNGNRVLNKKEHGIRKQIADLENNITLWQNNLEFFAASKTADKLRDQFEEKIKKAEQEIAKLKSKLSIIREF